MLPAQLQISPHGKYGNAATAQQSQNAGSDEPGRTVCKSVRVNAEVGG